MELQKKHKEKQGGSYGGGAFSDTFAGNEKLITNRAVARSVAGSYREYYMGEGGGFPRVRAVVSQVSPRLPVASPNTKKGAEWILTNLWLVLDAGPSN
jgi:hypothetical protein